MQRIQAFSSKPTILSLCSNSCGTIIGPVIEVQIVKFLDQYGLEIAIPSPNERERTTNVMISRGKSRFVDEIHIPKPNSDQVEDYFLNVKNLKEETLAWHSRGQASTKLVQHMVKVQFATRNLCGHPQHHSQPSVFFHTKNHSYDQEELESFSCQFFAWRSRVNSGLQNGYKNFASLRSR